jgi:hypothetical protein
MKMWVKNLFFILSLGVSFSACGGGSDTSTVEIPNARSSVITGDSYGISVNSGARADYNVTVADETIIGARLLATAYVNYNGTNYKVSVCDSFTELGEGKYTLNNCSQRPENIFAYGGFIDMDGNGALDSNESTVHTPLIVTSAISDLQNNSITYIVTPITTLVSEIDRATLVTLINKLGYIASNKASTTLFFGTNDGNKALCHVLNALFSSMTENGLDVQAMSPELVALINSSSYSGLAAIRGAINTMKANPTSYETKYGKSQIQSFLSDSRVQAVLTGDDTTILSKLLAKKARLGTFRIQGFTNTYFKGDNIISDAIVTMYMDDNTTPIATAVTDQYGKYNFEIYESNLPKNKTLILVAEKNGFKITSSLKSNTVWSRRINNILSSSILPDLAVNYVTTLTSLRINSKQSGTTSPKIVFDATGYANKNSSNEKYFIPIPMLYEAKVLPWGANVDINVTFLEKFAKTLPASAVPYALDLETWNFGYIDESSASINSKLAKYITVIDTLRTSRPDLKFGYFGLLPQLSILTPYFKDDNVTYMPSIIAGMDTRYEATKELANHVDVLFPELYTYWPESNSIAYTSRVSTGISIYGIKYKKPIIPFIWPAYSTGVSDIPGGQYLSNTYWALEFSTLWQNSNVNGIAIWGGKDYTQPSYPTQTWDENLYWWQYVKQYIYP